jgi:CheY-like chemotaxis protein
MRQRSAVIIDDEPDVTTYLATLLADNGWRVLTANRADEGLELVRRERPDAVLLDLMMPERGGLNVLVNIRKDPELKATPVVVVSGIQSTLTTDYHAYLERFKHYRPDAYLDKPVKVDELLAKLEELLGTPA